MDVLRIVFSNNEFQKFRSIYFMDTNSWCIAKCWTFSKNDGLGKGLLMGQKCCALQIVLQSQSLGGKTPLYTHEIKQQQ